MDDLKPLLFFIALHGQYIKRYLQDRRGNTSHPLTALNSNQRTFFFILLGETFCDALDFPPIILLMPCGFPVRLQFNLEGRRKGVLTLTSVIAISTTLPTTIKASNVFQASAK